MYFTYTNRIDNQVIKITQNMPIIMLHIVAHSRNYILFNYFNILPTWSLSSKYGYLDPQLLMMLLTKQ